MTLSSIDDFRIAHLSDPHLSRRYYREHMKSFKKLLRMLEDERIDHLIISGDIVSTADEDDFLLAREILSKAGFLESDRLTVVPGNHDIFGGPHRAIDVVSFPRHIRSVDFQYRHKLFRTAFAESFEGVEKLAPEKDYPFLKKVGPLAVIGLSSIPPWSLRHNPLGTNGAIDPDQFQALSEPKLHERLNGLIPVVAIHHHFNELSNDNPATSSWWKRIESSTMRMRKRRKLLRLFRDLNVRYILHGHVHRNEIYERDGIVLANGAGSVCDDPVRNLKYNRLTASRDGSGLKTIVLPVPYETSRLDEPIRRINRLQTFPIPTSAT
jgi:3',5'-cyclic AMP phosphodiesterase CpdA